MFIFLALPSRAKRCFFTLTAIAVGLVSTPAFTQSSTLLNPSGKVQNPELHGRHFPKLETRPYTLKVAYEHLSSEPVLPILGAISLASYGIKGWGWGNQKHFHMSNEGFFGRKTYAGGMDKLGHAWTASVVSDIAFWRMRQNGFGVYESAVTAAGMSWLFMASIEVGDGFSHAGFSKQDLVANSVGVAFSFLRNTVPSLKDKLDYRMLYFPGRYSDLRGPNRVGGTSVDYQSKKFLLALKASGFEDLKRTPLRYLELHAGYFARGFSAREVMAGVPKKRELYVGIGLNLNELLLAGTFVNNALVNDTLTGVFSHVQVPFTSLNSAR